MIEICIGIVLGMFILIVITSLPHKKIVDYWSRVNSWNKSKVGELKDKKGDGGAE